jgi:hypothetical protein
MVTIAACAGHPSLEVSGDACPAGHDGRRPRRAVGTMMTVDTVAEATGRCLPGAGRAVGAAAIPATASG